MLNFKKGNHPDIKQRSVSQQETDAGFMCKQDKLKASKSLFNSGLICQHLLCDHYIVDLLKETNTGQLLYLGFLINIIKRLSVSNIWYSQCSICSDGFPAKLHLHVDTNKIKLLLPYTHELSHTILAPNTGLDFPAELTRKLGRLRFLLAVTNPSAVG